MFPDDDESTLETRLNTYIQRGYDEIGRFELDPPISAELRGRAVSFYAYYLAFGALYRSMSAAPATLAFVDQGTRTRNQAQIDHFGSKSRDYLSQFQAITTRPTDQTQGRPTSSRMANRFTF